MTSSNEVTLSVTRPPDYDHSRTWEWNKARQIEFWAMGCPGVTDPRNGMIVLLITGASYSTSGAGAMEMVHPPPQHTKTRLNLIASYHYYRMLHAKSRLMDAEDSYQSKVIAAKMVGDTGSLPSEGEAQHVAFLRAEYQHLRDSAKEAGDIAGWNTQEGEGWDTPDQTRQVMQMEDAVTALHKIARAMEPPSSRPPGSVEVI